MFEGLDWGMLASGMPTPSLNPQTPVQPNFDQRFGAAFPRSPIDPEVVAQNLAARGVPPPPVDIPPQGNVGAALTGQEPYRLAGPEAMDQWRTSVDVTNAGVGGSPAPQGTGGSSPGAPTDIRTPVQQAAEAPTEMSASSRKGGDGLLDALKGVKAPAAPELQRLGTPGAPRPTNAIKGGNLLALLQSLNVGQNVGDRNLPSTLASALRRG